MSLPVFLCPAVAKEGRVQLSLEGVGLNAEVAEVCAEVAEKMGCTLRSLGLLKATLSEEVPAFAGMTSSGRGNRGDSGLRRNRSRDKHRVDGGLHGDDGDGVYVSRFLRD